MPLKDELSRFVAQRADEMGITAERLAQIAGVDSQVIEGFLKRGEADLCLSVAERIANAVGLALGVVGQKAGPGQGRSAAAIAAQTASTSYRDVLTPEALIRTLVCGIVPEGFAPHLRALLDEAPIGILADLAYELQSGHGIPAAQGWKTMRALAVSLKCCREIWY